MMKAMVQQKIKMVILIIILELQWGNNLSEDPKKIFSITEKAINFIENSVQENAPFICRSLTTLFTPI